MLRDVTFGSSVWLRDRIERTSTVTALPYPCYELITSHSATRSIHAPQSIPSRRSWTATREAAGSLEAAYDVGWAWLRGWGPCKTRCRVAVRLFGRAFFTRV